MSFTAEMRAELVRQIEAAPLVFPGGTSGKRWISDIWASAEELLAAHKAGIVVLSRCDLTSVFSDKPEAAKVGASEIRHLNATFHFVSLPKA